MKKYVYLILLFMIGFPMGILADSAGPSILGYDAVVINKNGAKDSRYDDVDNVIPYNSKIHVTDEYDGEVSACLIENIKNCYEFSFQISIKDIMVLKEEVVPKDLLNVDDSGSSLVDDKSKIIIISDKGVKLKKGPSDAYGEYDTVIPNKTILNSSYSIYRGKDSYSWYYIDSNGYKGWINSEDNDYVYVNDLSRRISIIDSDFYSDTTYTNKIFTIPAYTAIDEIYYGNGNRYVRYNNQEGFINWENSSFIPESKLGYILTIRKTTLTKNGNVLETIELGEKIKIKYGHDDLTGDYPLHSTSSICIKEEDCYYFVEYKGKEGLISSKDAVSLYYEDKIIEKKYNKDLKMYDINYRFDSRSDEESDESFLKRHETGLILPANTKITSYINDYGTELIKYNNNFYWVFNNEDDENEENNSELEKEENKEEPLPVDKPKDNNKETKNDKSLNTIIYALIAAILVSAVGIITAVIINSNKKDKQQETKKEETKVEKEIVKEEVKVTNKEINDKPKNNLDKNHSSESEEIVLKKKKDNKGEKKA